MHSHENLSLLGNGRVHLVQPEAVGMKANRTHDPSLPQARKQTTAAGGKAAVLLAEAVE